MGTGDSATLRALAGQRELKALLEAVLETVEVPLAEPQPEYFI